MCDYSWRGGPVLGTPGEVTELHEVNIFTLRVMLGLSGIQAVVLVVVLEHPQSGSSKTDTLAMAIS